MLTFPFSLHFPLCPSLQSDTPFHFFPYTPYQYQPYITPSMLYLKSRWYPEITLRRNPTTLLHTHSCNPFYFIGFHRFATIPIETHQKIIPDLFWLTFRNRPPHSIKRGVGLFLLHSYFFFTHFASAFKATLFHFYCFCILIYCVVQGFHRSFSWLWSETIFTQMLSNPTPWVSPGTPSQGSIRDSLPKTLFVGHHLNSCWECMGCFPLLFACVAVVVWDGIWYWWVKWVWGGVVGTVWG